VTEQEALAILCAALPRLRKSFRGPASAASRALVEQAARAASENQPVTPFLARLKLNERYVPTVRGALPTALPAAEAESEPMTGEYVCPNGTCDRVEERPAGAGLPTCNLHDQALRFRADQ
jgi:hypothetical protein